MEISPRRQVWISDGVFIHRGLTWTNVPEIFMACLFPKELREKYDLRRAKQAISDGERRWCPRCHP